MRLLEQERETASEELDTCPSLDQEVEEAAGFFCHACLVDVDNHLMSPDPRYCQQCYEILKQEAEKLPPKSRKPDWIPRVAQDAPAHPDAPLIMSIAGNGNFSMDIIKPTDASRPVGKRGPKCKPLPQELILQWTAEGMGSRAISSKLRNELGINVCYKTVQRALLGERRNSNDTTNQANP